MARTRLVAQPHIWLKLIFIRQLGQDLPLRLGQLEGIFSFYRARGHSQQTHIFS